MQASFFSFAITPIYTSALVFSFFPFLVFYFGFKNFGLRGSCARICMHDLLVSFLFKVLESKNPLKASLLLFITRFSFFTFSPSLKPSLCFLTPPFFLVFLLNQKESPFSKINFIYTAKQKKESLSLKTLNN